RLKKEKCPFCLPNITYLGHVIEATGTSPYPEKVKAILECSVSTDEEQLRFFLGKANYNGKFVPNLSTDAVPFYQLTQNNVHFK
ncbi:hypothetical protein NL529_27865, partial [Klebsiella pneumoniae]|nr:hypothetical protein [Klebsiella pneumoniae]